MKKARWVVLALCAAVLVLVFGGEIAQKRAQTVGAFEYSYEGKSLQWKMQTQVTSEHVLGRQKHLTVRYEYTGPGQPFDAQSLVAFSCRVGDWDKRIVFDQKTLSAVSGQGEVLEGAVTMRQSEPYVFDVRYDLQPTYLPGGKTIELPFEFGDAKALSAQVFGHLARYTPGAFNVLTGGLQAGAGTDAAVVLKAGAKSA